MTGRSTDVNRRESVAMPQRSSLTGKQAVRKALNRVETDLIEDHYLWAFTTEGAILWRQ